VVLEQLYRREYSASKHWISLSLACLAVFLVYFFTLNSAAKDCYYGSSLRCVHATSLLELDYSMWAKHSFALGITRDQIDTVSFNGHYYSALAPGAAFFALPFTAIGFMLDRTFTLYGSAFFMSEVFMAFANAFATVFVYIFAKLYFRRSISLFVATAYAFATITWPFATVFFQHDLSALFTVMATYFAVKFVRRSQSAFAGQKNNDSAYGYKYSYNQHPYNDYNPVRNYDYKLLVLSGIIMGAAFTVEYIDAILIPIIMLYVLLSVRKTSGPILKSALAFSPVVLGSLLIAYYNFVCFGNPFASSEALYLHSNNLLQNFSFPLYLGIWVNTLSPYRGILLYCPILIAGIVGLGMMAKRRGLPAEALLLASMFLGVFIPYSMWYVPDGGLSFGPRFLITAIPFLTIPVGFTLEYDGEGAREVIYFLYMVGVIENGIGAMTSALSAQNPVLQRTSPLSYVYTSYLYSPFLNYSLPKFLNGNLVTWWVDMASQFWPLPGLIIILSLLAFAAIVLF
jgi:hypothetical protein